MENPYESPAGPSAAEEKRDLGAIGLHCANTSILCVAGPGVLLDWMRGTSLSGTLASWLSPVQWMGLMLILPALVCSILGLQQAQKRNAVCGLLGSSAAVLMAVRFFTWVGP